MLFCSAICQRSINSELELDGYIENVLTVLVSWMTGPSAMGSENGIPISIISAPPACIASNMGTVSSLRGYPAVIKVTRAGTPYKVVSLYVWAVKKIYLCVFFLENLS